MIFFFIIYLQASSEDLRKLRDRRISYILNVAGGESEHNATWLHTLEAAGVSVSGCGRGCGCGCAYGVVDG